jgi:hypothetical protein
MLHLVAPYVAEMLHLKSLTINRVAGVAGFQTMSPCKLHIKSLIINMVAGVFDGFLSMSSLHTPIPPGEDGGWRGQRQRSESGKRESGNETSVGQEIAPNGA